MSIDADYLALIERLASAVGPQTIVGLDLPEATEEVGYRDEFGFVRLADGSVGPFYVSLKPVLADLLSRFPRRQEIHLDAAAVARGLEGGNLPDRALSLGAFNALSHRLMRLAGYVPPDRGPAKESVRSGAPIGVVGYFAPVIDRMVEGGNEVLVLEQQPERVPERARVRPTTRPADLSACAEVLCTASVLINDSLDELLHACRSGVRFQLIGPTGSGLPDALFARGVESVGGILFDDPARLEQVLATGEPWGRAGRKYEIHARDYPGAARLIADAAVLTG